MGAMDHRMMSATRGLTATESDTIISFLERMQAAADEVQTPST